MDENVLRTLLMPRKGQALVLAICWFVFGSVFLFANAPGCGVPFWLIAGVYGLVYWFKRNRDAQLASMAQQFPPHLAEPLPKPVKSDGSDELFIPPEL